MNRATTIAQALSTRAESTRPDWMMQPALHRHRADKYQGITTPAGALPMSAITTVRPVTRNSNRLDWAR
jgi:hypothetical protein